MTMHVIYGDSGKVVMICGDHLMDAIDRALLLKLEHLAGYDLQIIDDSLKIEGEALPINGPFTMEDLLLVGEPFKPTLTDTDLSISKPIVEKIKFDPYDFNKCYEESYDEDHRDNWFIPRSIGKVQARSYNRSYNKIRSSLPRKFRKDDLLNLN